MGIRFRLIIVLFLLWGEATQGLTIDSKDYEARRYFRCYALFTGERVSPTDTSLTQIQEGKQNGTDACMALLDRAMLNDQGLLAATNGVVDPIGRKILNRFLEFYQSNLANPSFISNYGSLRYEGDLYDVNEPAYQFLFTLFAKSQNYRDVVTRNHSIFAKRESKVENSSNSVRSAFVVTSPNEDPRFASSVVATSKTALVALPHFNSQLIEQGLLKGLIKDERTLAITNRNGLSANQHFGGGLFGSPTYLFANNTKRTAPDGGLDSYRVLAADTIQDTLCRSLPWVRSVDALSFVVSKSELPYRKVASCAQCHAGSDRVAAGLRKAGFDQLFAGSTGFWKTYDQTEPPLAFPEITGDPSFHLRPAEGTFYFRTFRGELINQKFSGFDGLGNIISNLDDFYVCAAKRHYQFLTGIDVDISDLNDAQHEEPLTKAELAKRDLVIKLGLDLRKHQSLRSLIRAIIEKPEFALPGRGL